MAEGLGVQSATVAAIAAATFGLITGSLLGGIATFLIKKFNVQIKADENVERVQVPETIAGKLIHRCSRLFKNASTCSWNYGYWSIRFSAIYQSNRVFFAELCWSNDHCDCYSQY